MPGTSEADFPHENQTRKWYAGFAGRRLEYWAFRTLAEARARPDVVAVLDLDADAYDPLATFPARRVEADPAALDRLRVDLGMLLARVMEPETPDLEGRVRYETAAVLELCDVASRLGGVVLHQGLRPFGLESDVEAVFLGVREDLAPESRRRVDLLLAWWEAVGRGDVDAVRELIDRGVPVGSRDRYGPSALGTAAARGDVAMVRLLLDRGADPNQPDARGRTPTTDAADRASTLGGEYGDEILRLLIEAGGHLGFREAVILGDVELARSILDADPAIDVSGDAGVCWSDNYLMVAASFGRLEMARFLLDRGADVHATDDDVDYSALGLAASNGRADIAALLLDRGADPNRGGGNGFAPLANAAERGHADVFRLLLERGARRTLADAVFLNDAEMVAKLLPAAKEDGPDLDTLLFHCGRRLADCDLHVLRPLLRAWSEGGGALGNPEVLPQAAAMGRLDVARLLVEHGFNPGEPDRDGVTPAVHAERAGHAEVAEFLRAAARDRRA
ncbi:ankyrin repeat domain-containing protein [Paludisphaera sp.]|uniref:ankyrin repeat domain-containing protein n=1 Tax=Paludisphaera sp. TaxID=2017432 RepID=UPI00301D5F2A